MIALEDLDKELQTVLAELGRHPKIAIGLGQKAVFIYVQGRQTEKLAASKISKEHLPCVQIVRTGRISPAAKKKSK